MMNKLHANKDFLKVLMNADPKLRTAMIKNSSNEIVCILSEIILNFLDGNLNVSPNHMRQLVMFKRHFRNLRDKCCTKKKNNINKQKARKILVQSGGALPFLLAPLLSLIAKAALSGAVAAGVGVGTKKILE